MKLIYTSVLLLLVGLPLSYGQETPETMLSTFFSFVGEGNYSQAIEYVVSTNSTLKNDSTLVTRFTNNLRTAQNRNGEYCGYELIEKEKISDSYINYSYFIKFRNNPVRIEFTFYKPLVKWQINSIQLVPGKGRDQEGKNQGNKGMNGGNPNHQSHPNHPQQNTKAK
jgi:hypothetical protein